MSDPEPERAKNLRRIILQPRIANPLSWRSRKVPFLFFWTVTYYEALFTDGVYRRVSYQQIEDAPGD